MKNNEEDLEGQSMK